MANSYLYIHKMAKAHEDAIKMIVELLERHKPLKNTETCKDLKKILDILEKPDKEEEK